MNEVEKAMLVVIANDELSPIEAMDACYEIHKREMDKLRMELSEGAKLAMAVSQDKQKRILTILLEESMPFTEAVEKFGK